MLNVPGGISTNSICVAVSFTRHAKPVAVIAARRLASVTTDGSGCASISVAQAGTPVELYVNPPTIVTEPLIPLTTTSTAPTDPAGVTAVTVVAFTA